MAIMKRYLVVQWYRATFVTKPNDAPQIVPDVVRNFDSPALAWQACEQLAKENRDNIEAWGVYEFKEGAELEPRQVRKVVTLEPDKS